MLFFTVLLGMSMMIYTGERAEASVSDGIVQVKIDGRATAGKYTEAIDNAEKKAVFKVLSHLARPDNSAGSTFSKIMLDYHKYVSYSENISSREMNGILQVIMNVSVDVHQLKNDLREYVSERQLENGDLTAALMIKSKGTSEPEIMDEVVMTAFNKGFEELGFVTEFANETAERISVTRYMDFPNYEFSMMKPVKDNEWLVTMAVIGEVRITSLMENPAGNGYSAKATVMLRAYDIVNNCVMGTFTEDYTMQGATAKEAESLVIQKASMDSAENFSKDTLRYWQGRLAER